MSFSAKVLPLYQVFVRLFLLRLLLPLLGVSLFSIGMALFMGVSTFEQQQLVISQSVSYSAAHYLNNARDVLSMLALTSEVSLPADTSRMMEIVAHIHTYFDTFYRLDEQGKVTASLAAAQNVLGMDMSKQDYYQQLEHASSSVISKPFMSWSTGHLTVFLAEKTKDGGAMVGELNLAALQKAISSATQTSSSEAVFLTDQSGNLIAHPRSEWVEQQVNLGHLEIIRQGRTAPLTLVYFDQGALYIGGAVPVPLIGWIVVTQTPLLALIGPYLFVAGLLVMGSLLLWLIVSRTFLRRFRRYVVAPLTQLSQATHAIAQGDYMKDGWLSEIPDAFGEIASLNADFFNMSAALRARQQRLQDVEIELRYLNAGLEQRVNERTAQLQMANREMEAFSYSVSHDLRSPLRHIDGYSRMLIELYGGQLEPPARRYLDQIRESSQRMAQLIDDLLELSRVTRREIRQTEFDLRPMADEVIADLRTTDPRRLLDWVAPTSLIIRADPSLMRIVLMNLLGNAWKFTARCKETRIELGWMLKEDQRVIFIRDNGAGFDMTYVAKIFAPFHRLHTDREFEGNGIGLALVQRIIHRHGGKIWAESALGEGATLYFTLDSPGSGR